MINIPERNQIPENIKEQLIVEYILHKKKVCPIDLVYFYYNEIRDLLIHILNQTNKRAIIEAELAKKRILEEKTLGPLDGVPIAWKDLFDFKGVQTQGGSKLLENNKPAL